MYVLAPRMVNSLNPGSNGDVLGLTVWDRGHLGVIVWAGQLALATLSDKECGRQKHHFSRAQIISLIGERHIFEYFVGTKFEQLATKLRVD